MINYLTASTQSSSSISKNDNQRHKDRVYSSVLLIYAVLSPHPSRFATHLSRLPARSERGSGSPPDCHSLPRSPLRCLRGEGLDQCELEGFPFEGKLSSQMTDEVDPIAPLCINRQKNAKNMISVSLSCAKRKSLYCNLTFII